MQLTIDASGKRRYEAEMDNMDKSKDSNWEGVPRDGTKLKYCEKDKGDN